MNKSLVSIIVPIYNGEKYILKCLNSLVNQTYKNIEIIVVNDGSIDNSLSLVKEMALKNNNIKVIDKINTGVSDTRNAGIDMASGEFLMFVDADDWIEKETVQECVQNVGNCDAVRFLEYIIDDGPLKLVSCKYNNTPDRITNSNEVFEDLIKNDIQGHSCCFFYKSSIIKQNNIRFNKRLVYCEDIVFLLNFLNKCNNIKLLNKPFYNYFKGNSNSATSSIENIIRNLKTLPLIRNEVIDTFSKDKKNAYIKMYDPSVLRIIRHYYGIFLKDLPFAEFKKTVAQINRELMNFFKNLNIIDYNLTWKIFINSNIKNRFWVLLIYLKIYKLKKRLRKS